MFKSRTPRYPGFRKSVMMTRYYRVTHPGLRLVEGLIGLFRKRRAEIAPPPSSERQRRRALRTLGLADPVEAAAIQYRYRQLAMRHHPDRGGDIEAFIAIQRAMATLRVALPPRSANP